MIKIAINGCNGKMGQVVAEIVTTAFSDKACVAYGIDVSSSEGGAYPVYAGTKSIPADAP